MAVLPMPIFYPARHRECDVVALHKRAITPLGEKWVRPFGWHLKICHAALFVVHLEWPNLSPHALPKAPAVGAWHFFRCHSTTILIDDTP